ncbi:hypothetical protein SPF06_00950 [Sinomonas sp. JGH33]|uniref:Uncharacterized protein n=1 Tax=Sinomonas terricola TaxID=3110330 RepID=A0ABU5T0V1_9MICC|nr:hypothetical protein [Sinomonas sp. JGH33]MEA5453278.1 hypothetical protein [Sinomonas sp. JGH33]
MTPDDGLEALLAEHARYAHLLNEEVRCANPECWALIAEHCDELVQPDVDNAFAAHQAAVVRAAGWRKTEAREEWGVQTVLENGNTWTDPYTFRHTAELAIARSTEPAKLVRRTRLSYTAEFTDWEEA